MKIRPIALLLMALPATVSAAPSGRWAHSAHATEEYGIRNDSENRNGIRIVCAPDTTAIYFSVDGRDPGPNSRVWVTIGRKKFDVPVDEHGVLTTGNSVRSSYFYSLWEAIRAGSRMTVRLSTGETTSFTLKDSAKVLPREACTTDFGR
jgi:hypothetical protein